MPRVAGRGFTGRGELEAGLDADFESEVVAVFEIVVSDSGCKCSQKLEDTVEIDTWGDCVVRAHLPVESKLKCTSAVISLKILAVIIIIIYVELLPDSSDPSSNKRFEGGCAWPAQDSIELNWNLKKFPICGSSIRRSINSCVVLVDCIVDHAALEANTKPIVNIVTELNIKAETWLKSEILSCIAPVRIRLHIIAIKDTPCRELALDRSTDGGVHKEVVVGS